MSSGDNLNHYTGVRVRVVGEGNLRLTLASLQDVKTQGLVPIAMTNPTNRFEFRLANIIDQRVSVQLQTTAINEWFRVTKIHIFAKEIFSQYPG